MGGLTLFIASKLKEEKPATVPTQTKAANITYRKLIALNVATPELPTSTGEEPTPTVDVTTVDTADEVEPSIAEGAGEEFDGTPTPTQIDLVTTPFLTPEPTETELAYNDLTPTETETALTATVSSAQKETIKNLPQSGVYTIPLLIIFGALMLIFFSFML